MARLSVKTNEGNGSQVVEIKHITRIINTFTDKARGFVTGQDLDAYLNEQFSQGWDLFSAQVIQNRTAKEVGGGTANPIEMLYIMVKYAG